MNRVLHTATFIQAHISNFSQAVRSTNQIKYIVVHYTGNTNDTARNNAMYFHERPVVSSAHYFVSRNSIYQSVPDNHAAYAVGLGSRKEPYDHTVWGWKVVTNANSISVEICGGKNSPEAENDIKDLAAQLVADLMEKYNIDITHVCRHYDVTGKYCPWWAVSDKTKWQEFISLVSHYINDNEEDIMKDNAENYETFCKFMDRYLAARSLQPVPDWAAAAYEKINSTGLMAKTEPKSFTNRAELAVILSRLLDMLEK